ncbi:hypothetical protein Hanom_Chr13g01183291 [Helianthus anomalus]
MGDDSIPDKVGKETKETFFGVGDLEFNSSAAVSPRFVSHGTKVNQSKDGGPKYFKRSKGKKSLSPMGSYLEHRPKKRPRAQVEKSELFGLDDLISKGPYSFQDKPPMEVAFVDVSAASEEGVSLDLNRRASCSQG